jgi:L-aspartate oxidase
MNDADQFQTVSWWDERTGADVVIVGAGIAGLTFALRLSDSHHIVVITKGALGESNTRYAQGGMAAAIGPNDDPELHLADTVAAGDGLTDVEAARAMAERGASAVRWLLKQGAHFDLDGPVLALGHEAAHSQRRILHAGGDATGAEIERALVERLRMRPQTTILEHTSAVDIARSESGAAAGFIVAGSSGTLHLIEAPFTVLAAGGIGQLWAVTSNPEAATADGIGMALRAGVDLADLEFAQFHPTVLNMPGVNPFLISEAVRGEGAWLVNGAGERFMTDIDSRAELAPRNVVAASIQDQLTRTNSTGVFLDLRHLDASFIHSRFPTIIRYLADVGLDLTRDLIPVAPAAHYFMGGIIAGTDGSTSLPGLLAIGEIACTGVHGANRLASNSLLEGLVFGINAADMVSDSPLPDPGPAVRSSPGACTPMPAKDIRSYRARLKQIMTRDVGVLRTEDGLIRARSEIAAIPLPDGGDVNAGEIRNMLQAATQIASSALLREESRGGHIRADFPITDPNLDGQHQIVQTIDGEIIRSFGALNAPSIAVSKQG